MARRSALIARREWLRCNQETMAERAGVHLTTYKRWESGDIAKIQLRHHRRLAQALEVSLDELDDLLLRDDERPSYPAPVDRREFIASTVAMATTTAVPVSRRRLGATDVARLSAAADDLYALDDTFGGGAVYDRAARQLGHVRRLLDEAAYGPTVGRDLQVVAGRLTEMVGWLAFDAGHQDAARRFFTEAFTAARLAENDRLTVLVLTSMSLQACRHGSAREGLHLAEAAERSARPFGSTRLMSLLSARKALAHARVADPTSCIQALVQAEQLLEDGPADDDEGWMAFWGPADLHWIVAQAHLSLGDPGKAATASRSALAAVDAAYPRNEGLYLAGLATALVTDGEIEQGATVASDALARFSNVSSARMRGDLQSLGQSLQPHAAQPAVRGYLDQLATADLT